MLAAFYAGLPDGVAPGQMLRQWNAKCEQQGWSKDWQYNGKDADLWHRDAKTALKRLGEVSENMASFLPPGIGLTKERVRAKK